MYSLQIYRVFGKYCPIGRLGIYQCILKRRGVPKKGLVSATKLEQYTCICLIIFLLSLDSFNQKSSLFEWKNYLFSFDFIIKLVWPPCGLGSAARDDAITFTCVLHEHGFNTNPFFGLPRFYTGFLKKDARFSNVKHAYASYSQWW